MFWKQTDAVHDILKKKTTNSDKTISETLDISGKRKPYC